MATQQKERIQAHGLTKSAMASLQQDQVGGAQATTTASDGTTEINTAEKGIYHVKLETPLYHQTTGARLSTPFVQKFTPREYQQAKDANAFSGYTVEILHDPTQGGDVEEVESAGAAVADLTEATALELMYEKVVGKKPTPEMDPLEIRKEIDEALDAQAKDEVEKRVALELEKRLQAEQAAPAAMSGAMAESVSPGVTEPATTAKKGPGRPAANS